MGGKNRRSIINYSVKRQMQIRLFIKILGIILIGVGLMAAVFYFFSNREINSSYRQFHIHANNFLELLRPTVFLSIFLALLASAAITLFLPIRIAGPLFRIERDMKEKVANGDLTVRFILRTGDEVGELADAVNHCLDSLGKKIETTQKLTNELESRLSGNEGDEIKGLVVKIKDNLKQFKVR
ncbi:MAG: methyl-accepting chemotaxis protein [Nitrospiraceae bacterium]|nr:MAG: methyl-accepting chemotaxis protein [Nitrospiraceae bacterium]